MSTISASTTTTTAYKVTADTTGTLVLQTGATPTTAVTVDASQNVGFGVTPTTSTSTGIFQNQGGILWAYSSSFQDLTQNAYYNGGYKYTTSAVATMYRQQAGSHVWFNAVTGTAGNAITFTQALTLDSSGNLNINNPASNSWLQWGGVNTINRSTAGAASLSIISLAANPANEPTTVNVCTDSSGNTLKIMGGVNVRGGQIDYCGGSAATDAGCLRFRTGTGGGQGEQSERARFDASGNFLVGTTTSGYIGSEILTLSKNSGTTKWSVGPYTGQAGQFYVTAGSGTGVFLTSTSATAWSSNSDERLKTDLKPIENAAQKVASLRAVTGRYKTDDVGYSRVFLIAQDVQAVLPEAVTTTTLPGTDDQIEYLSLAYTDTIPLLVAAIQEQQAIIKQLQADVAALKGAQ
jgi:hypothetical protein